MVGRSIGRIRRDRRRLVFALGGDTGKETADDFPAGFSDKAPAFSPDGRTLVFVRWHDDRRIFTCSALGWTTSRKESSEYPPQPRSRLSWRGLDARWKRDRVLSRCSYWQWRPLANGGVGFHEAAEACHCVGATLRAWQFPARATACRIRCPIQTSIWRVDLRGPNQTPTAPVPLIQSTRNQGFPTYSPDGKRVAFNSDASGHEEIWVCNSDGSNATQLTSVRIWAEMVSGRPEYCLSLGGRRQDGYLRRKCEWRLSSGSGD